MADNKSIQKYQEMIQAAQQNGQCSGQTNNQNYCEPYNCPVYSLPFTPYYPAPCPGCGRCPFCGRGGYYRPQEVTYTRQSQ